MGNPLTRGAWKEIDLGALHHNIQEIQQHVGAHPLMGVVKADAYGHGAVETVRVLQRCGVRRLAVATIEEGLQLRKAGVTDPVTVLSSCPADAAPLLAEQNLQPLIGSLAEAKQFASHLPHGTTLNIFAAIDTGMCRVGLPAEDPRTIEDLLSIFALDSLQCEGLISHFAASDEEDLSFTELQHRRFTQCAEQLRTRGIHPKTLCLANSAAIMAYPASWHDLVRPGIILYGLYPSSTVDRTVLDLHPVMQVKARIMRLRLVEDATPVSYGCTYHSKGKRLIATLPLGYDDGYFRCLSSRCRVIIGGRYAPQVGRICMDQCMVDVTDIPHVKTGDVAVIMGSDQGLSVTADELAERCSTINYEIVCAFGHRLPAVYINR
jgi:alanine racemase